MCPATLWTESPSLHPAMHTSIWIVYGQWMGAYILVNRNFSLVFKTRFFHQKTIHHSAETVEQWWQNHLSWKRPLRSLRPSAVVHSIGHSKFWLGSAGHLYTGLPQPWIWKPLSYLLGCGTVLGMAQHGHKHYKAVISYSQEECHLCQETLDMSWGLVQWLRDWPFNTALIHGSPTNTC